MSGREGAPCDQGGARHRWHAPRRLRALRRGRLVNVRVCDRCGLEQTKPYGSQQAWT